MLAAIDPEICKNYWFFKSLVFIFETKTDFLASLIHILNTSDYETYRIELCMNDSIDPAISENYSFFKNFVFSFKSKEGFLSSLIHTYIKYLRLFNLQNELIC